MRRIKPLFAASFERRMSSDERAILEDADRIGEHMNVKHAPARRVRHAVQIAANADHAFVRHAPLEPKHRLVGSQRQGFERAPLLGERLIDDTTGRRMHARIGNTIQPMPELDV
jgi:hypothetical protein